MKNVNSIKSKANVKAILEHYSIDYEDRGDILRSACPLHGGSNKSAFAINPSGGQWFCHTKCKEGNDIINLVQRLGNLSFFKACIKIAELSGFSLDGIEFTKEEISHYEEAKRWFSAFVKEYEFDEYSLEGQEIYPVKGYRGLSEETLRDNGVFYSREFITSTYRAYNRIGFPIYHKGLLIGVDLRATRITDNVKWLRQPKGLSCGHTLYNYDEALLSEEEYVIIVEGIIDCLKLKQYGYNTVCSFGASITKQQKEMLEKLAVDVYIAYDGDEAGKLGTNSVFNMLKKTCNVYNIELPDKVDPGSIEEDKFEELFSSAKLMRKEK